MNMLIQNSSLYPYMIKYIFFLLCLPSFVFAETWRCEPFFNENSRGNINEQKIVAIKDLFPFNFFKAFLLKFPLAGE